MSVRDGGRLGGPVRPTPGSNDGVRIRARRNELGISQSVLGELVGVSRQTIISMESGDYAPSVYLALRVATALDSTVEALWSQ